MSPADDADPATPTSSAIPDTPSQDEPLADEQLADDGLVLRSVDDVGTLLRLLRARLKCSQREFAELAGVPRSTVDRLESGRCQAKLDTLLRLTSLAGCRLVLLDQDGRRVRADEERDRLRDGGDRHFPAHLRVFKTPAYISINYRDYWGYDRVAWDEREAPAYTFWRRPRRRPPR